MKTLILLLLIALTSCTSGIPQNTSGRIVGIALLENDLAIYELQKDNTSGKHRKHFEYFYDLPNAYNINDRIDSLTAEQIYPNKFQTVKRE